MCLTMNGFFNSFELGMGIWLRPLRGRQDIIWKVTWCFVDHKTWWDISQFYLTYRLMKRSLWFYTTVVAILENASKMYPYCTISVLSPTFVTFFICGKYGVNVVAVWLSELSNQKHYCSSDNGLIPHTIALIHRIVIWRLIAITTTSTLPQHTRSTTCTSTFEVHKKWR